MPAQDGVNTVEHRKYNERGQTRKPVPVRFNKWRLEHTHVENRDERDHVGVGDESGWLRHPSQ